MNWPRRKEKPSRTDRIFDLHAFVVANWETTPMWYSRVDKLEYLESMGVQMLYEKAAMSDLGWYKCLEYDAWRPMEAAQIVRGLYPIPPDKRSDMENIQSMFSPLGCMYDVGFICDAVATKSLTAFEGCGPYGKGDVLVKPLELLNWYSQKSFLSDLPKVLAQALDNDVTHKPIPHGNAERFAGFREQVLGAGIACLAMWPEDCRKGDGTVNASALARLVDDKAQLFWPESMEVPLSPRVAEEQFRNWFSKVHTD
jgi:hypothetical protein